MFKSTRFAFLEAVRDVVSEIRYYLAFILVIQAGFACAFYILLRAVSELLAGRGGRAPRRAGPQAPATPSLCPPPALSSAPRSTPL